MKKIIFIVIDGLGEESFSFFNNKTPLEAAKKPNLNFLAKEGICGLVKPWHQPSQLPTSEECHLAVFGYHPKIFNPGRGVLEVLGIGEKIFKGDICIRANFATVNENLEIIDRRAGRIEKTEPLIKALNKIKVKGAEIKIKKAFGHRLGIIVRGKNLGEKLTSNDPKITGVVVGKIKAKNNKSKKTARILNIFLDISHSLLERHPLNKKRKLKGLLPANYLLLRGMGKFKEVKSFEKKYKMKSAFIAGGTLYKGIGRYLGMEEIKVKGATGLVNTDLRGKFLAAKKNIGKYDFIFLHIKAADTLAEDGDFLGKKNFLEKIDKNIKTLLTLKNVTLVVTGDHSTSSFQKRHSCLPVPILIYGNGKDRVNEFSERACQRGKFGKIEQLELMKKILTSIKNY